MIPSYRWPAFARWFSRRAAARIRGNFSRVMVAGVAEAQQACATHPALWVANHSSWWDPLVVLALSQQLGLEAFAMMAGENLERLGFFGLVGAFGVRRGHRRDGAAATRYAAALLDRPGRAVWIFGQGQTRPPAEPLRFHGGAASIHAGAKGSIVVPVGLRYVFADDPRPELWIALGAPLRALPRGAAGTTALEREVAACLRRIDEGSAAFTPLWPPTPTREGLATRALAGLARAVVWLFGARLQAAVAIDHQGALGPAHAATAPHRGERGEQHDVGEPTVPGAQR